MQLTVDFLEVFDMFFECGWKYDEVIQITENIFLFYTSQNPYHHMLKGRWSPERPKCIVLNSKMQSYVMKAALELLSILSETCQNALSKSKDVKYLCICFPYHIKYFWDSRNRLGLGFTYYLLIYYFFNLLSLLGQFCMALHGIPPFSLF